MSLIATLLPRANTAACPQLVKADLASSSHRLARTLLDDYISGMCGRVIQSSGPLRYAIVDGMNVRDSRVHNYPPRRRMTRSLLAGRRPYAIAMKDGPT
jgi:hypothetical protein